MRCSNIPTATLSTVGLGSCLGVTCYDPLKKAGAMLHAMLPDSQKHGSTTAPKTMYLDLGMTALLEAMTELGCDLEQLEFKIFGGAQIAHANEYFSIGRQNVATMKEFAANHQLNVRTWEVGGHCNRSIELHLRDGRVRLRMPAKPEVWL